MKKIYLLLFLLLFSPIIVNSQTIKICTLNLQHGQGTDSPTFNFQRQVDTVANCDIVAVQERSTSETGWNTPLSNAGFTQIVYRENSSLLDGNALWAKSTVTVNAIFDVALSDGFTGTGGIDVDKSAVAADVTFSGKRFTVANTHLCWSACSDAQRIDQLNALLSWRTSSLPAGRDVLLLGDFNFPPSLTSHYNLLTADYVDLWQDGIDKSIAVANWGDRDSNGTTDMPVDSNSITHDTRRIDYGWINETPTTLVLNSVTMPDTRETCPHALVNNGGSLPACTPEVTQLWDVTGDFGVKPSDHNLIEFVFSFAATFNPPSSLVASNGTGNNITLTWADNSTSETLFKIERKLGTGGTYSQIDTVSSNIITYSDTSSKTANRPYIYRVRAFDGTNNTAYSNEDDATTPITCTGGIKTDNAAYLETPTSMPLPLKGGFYIDETFCTKVIRVTDESDGASFGTNYSVWRTANYNNTKLFGFNFFNNSYHIIPWNPTTNTRDGEATQIANAPASLFAHYESANWSTTDADKLYVPVDAKLYYYRWSTNSYTLIKDLTSSFPAGYYFIQLYVSDDGNRFGVMIRNSSSDQGFIVYELSTDTLKLDIRTTDMNGITMDKGGNYVLYVPDTPFGTQKIYNVNTGTFEGLESDSGTGLPDYQIGHNDTGNDLVVSDDQWRGGFTSRAMSTPHAITLAYQYAPYWISHHISLRANNDNWALVSTYGEVGVSADATRFRRELFQVGVKGTSTGQLRRLAHSRSNWRIGGVKTVTNATNASPIVITSTAHGFETGQRPQMSGIGGNTAANGTFFITVIDANTFSLNGSTGNGTYTSGGQAYVETYWDTPRANPSLDGRYIFYTSNNNGVPGGSRNDLFALEITPVANNRKCKWGRSPTCDQ